ncbi:amino acid ABC transporter substrate-binding protein, PAAT family [Halothece sp. PCC 7418]|nr:amino acid ABC transporter substrate-binding protein, PAAT family [Halothece sp. PCC 7418]
MKKYARLKLTNPIIVAFWVAFSFIIAGEAKAETIFEEIERTGTLKIGIRNDAIPFGYRKPNGELTGYCVDFLAALKESIREKIDREELLVRVFQSTVSNRWSLVADGTVHIECGPNTIQDQIPEEEVTFSQPFFVTGTQFLILESQRDRIDLSRSLAGLRIGVLRGTSTEIFLQQQYPEATLIPLQGSTGRRRGVQGVLQGRFDSFVSDGILLIGEVEGLQALGFPPSNYAIIPTIPLSCDPYGMLLPNDLEWKNFVNKIIDSDRGSEIWQDWFNVVLPQIETTLQTCDERGLIDLKLE